MSNRTGAEARRSANMIRMLSPALQLGRRAERERDIPRATDPPRSQRAYRGEMSEFTFAHEADASRYTLHKGGDLVSVLDYRDDGRSVAMTRAYTVPAFRGHGYAGQLVDHVVALLERSADRVVIPVCWYVADWFDAHPERAGIVDTRRSA